MKAFALLSVLVCSVALADPPALEVTHTEPKVAGDILCVQAHAGTAVSHVWRVWTSIEDKSPSPDQIEQLKNQAESLGLEVIPGEVKDEKSYHMEVNGGSSIILPSWAGQEWLIFVCVSSDTGEQASELVHVLVPGAVPPPEPPNPPEPPDPPGPEPDDVVVPPGQFGIGQSLHAEAMKVNSADRKEVALKISAAALSVILETDGQAMIDGFQNRLSTALTTTQKGQWEGWRQKYLSELTRVKGQIGTDASKWRAAFSEISVGMALVR